MSLYHVLQHAGGGDLDLPPFAQRRLIHRADEEGNEHLDNPCAVPAALSQIVDDMLVHAAMRIYNHTYAPDTEIPQHQRIALGDAMPKLGDWSKDALDLREHAALAKRITATLGNATNLAGDEARRIADIPYLLAPDNGVKLKSCAAGFTDAHAQIESYLAQHGQTIDPETAELLSGAAIIADFASRRCQTIATRLQLDAERHLGQSRQR